MSELNHNASPLVARYRKLKANADDLKSEMDELRESIAKAVSKQGPYEDAEGYAQFRETGPSVRYNGRGVDKLAQTWASSTDPILTQCGQLLLAERSESPAKSSLYIK